MLDAPPGYLRKPSSPHRGAFVPDPISLIPCLDLSPGRTPRGTRKTRGADCPKSSPTRCLVPSTPCRSPRTARTSRPVAPQHSPTAATPSHSSSQAAQPRFPASDLRCPRVRVARTSHRRLAPLLPDRRPPEDDRPDGAAPTQRPAPPPHGRPGLADRDPRLPAPDGDRRVARPDARGGLPGGARRGAGVRRRASRRFLHAGGTARARRVRAAPRHPHRARGGSARSHAGGHRRLPRTRQ